MSRFAQGSLRRKAALVLALSTCVAATAGIAQAHDDDAGGGPWFTPGAPGVGDPYFPFDGNGGYDVKHYLLDVGYDPDSDVLTGKATIEARATQNLSGFNLDFDGLTIRSVTVDGRRATWSRDDGELTVVPRRGIWDHTRFTTVIEYDGSPQPLPGGKGFFHTADGALIAGEPHSAATWFPVNDHPTDKATYTFDITAPSGLDVISNGVLDRKRDKGASTTWTWRVREPMASYLATMAIGEYDVRSYRADGLKYVDAIHDSLFTRISPRTGEQFALSQATSLSYKRLARTISVPADGAQLSFWITRDTEQSYDFVFVEAHTAGQDDWTTLPDQNDHTSQSTGISCPTWLGMHPFLEHYQASNGDGTCSPTGSSGEWWAATGASDGYEQWMVDLSDYAGTDAEVSITYASDDIVQGIGVFVDDVTVSTGEGSTSFEDDADTLDGWMVPGAPAGSPANTNDWIAATVADAPPSNGEVADTTLARQPEIIDFLADTFGRYPFSAAGGVVHDMELSFALETQTRPVYPGYAFPTPGTADTLVVHELAHQWVGDSLAVRDWQHIWLNEGFATYTEWLWLEREGILTAQEAFDYYAAVIPADDPHWSVTIGDPGAQELFNIAVYLRGAMTLQSLRQEVGDDDFFRTLRRWGRSQAGGNVTTDQFVDLAERISGQQLDELFHTWLFTPSRPDIPSAGGRSQDQPRRPGWPSIGRDWKTPGR